MKRGYQLQMSLYLIFFVIFQASSLHASTKQALVIGNSAYAEVPLRNPVNDANDLAAALTKTGFSVTKYTNINHQDMEEAIRTFGSQLSADDTALFYFSGHGIQVDGLNYLLPVDIIADSENEVKYKAVPAEFVLDKLERAGTQLNIIILDACRNNPFKRFRSLSQGLAQMASPTGTIIGYATAPGSVAYDGNERNSPYTKYLLATLMIPGLEIEKVFKTVRLGVLEETANKQVPWESSSLTGDFYFVPPSGTPAPLFHDSFSETSVHDDWKWIRKSADTWKVHTDALHVTNSSWRDFWQNNNTGSLIYVDEPEGNYRVKTSVRGFPSKDHQQAGLFVYFDTDNYIRITAGFIQGKRQVAWSLERRGVFVDTAFLPLQQGSVQLRVEKRGTLYSAYYYNEQSQQWAKVGGTLSPPFADYRNKIGIAAVASPTAITFSFDYFTVERLDE